MKPKLLYHGSPSKIKGEKLLPKKARDLGNRKENIQTGVYATDIKEIAITMALISCKGVKKSSLLKYVPDKPLAIIYEGWPEKSFIYLYTLHSENFKKTGKIKSQWITDKPIKPLKIERLKVSKYLSLIRKTSKKEIDEWNKKFKTNPIQ
ncbi:MAG: hypothetical protein KKH88_03135 [Nanoarchaeota archaeon]|nr:hypothetical protein [Nanoarchaeota archaeon]